MALAAHVGDAGMLMEALFMQGVTMFYRGEFAAARAYYENALPVTGREVPWEPQWLPPAA